MITHHPIRHAVRLPLGALTLLGLLSGAALAQDGAVRVRAGEHPTYTRIVVDAPAGRDFTWGVEGRMLRLRVDGVSGFDTRPASAAGGLTRATGFAGSGVLDIALSCDCGARLMELGDGRLVLDIAEDAPRPALPASLAATEAPVQTTAESVGDDPGTGQRQATPAGPSVTAIPPRPAVRPVARPARPASEAPVAASPTPLSTQPVAPAIPAEPGETVVADTAALPTGDQPPAPATEATPPVAPTESPLEATEAAAANEQAAIEHTAAEQTATDHAATDPVATDGTADATVAAAREQLLRQLTRAAEEGFLTLAEPQEQATQPDAPEPHHDTATEAEAAIIEAMPADLPMRARTAAEIAETRTPRPRQTTESRPAHCLPDSQFAVTEWTDDAPVMLQIGAHRRAMVGEFDTANAPAVLAYVRLLIAQGFGLEAQGALQAFADQLPPSGLLHDLARLVDGDGVDSDGELALGLDCGGAHAVWASAAAGLDGRLDPATIDVDTLHLPITNLPPRLRTRLVLPIATAALEGGLITEAELLTGLAARAEPPPPDGDGMLLVLLARIDAARGEWRRAEATIEPLLNQTSPAAIEAMIRMVEFRSARQVAPPSGMAENMEAIAFSLGTDPLGRRLLRAAAHARAAGEGLGLALSALDRLAGPGQDGGAAAEAARDMLVDYAPSPEEGAAYAEAVLSYEALIGEGPEADRARLSVATHFMAIGLENLVEHVLEPALARNSPAARLTAAEAAVAGYDPARALDLLEGLTGDRAARTRAGALAASGDYMAAVAAAAETGDASLEARYAWLAGNWAAAAAAGDADRRILAAWMAGGGEMPPELREAAEADPALAATADAFSRPVEDDETSLLEAASDALEQSRRRRAHIGEVLTDG